MAYEKKGGWYDAYGKKDKNERANRGGPEFDRKGRAISEDYPSGGRRSGGKSAGGYGDKPAYGEKRSYGDKPAYGEKRSYGDKPAYGEKRSYGDKPAYGEKRSYGDKPAYGEKRSYGDKSAYGEKRSYGDKPAYGEKRSYGDKPAYGEKKSYGDKPVYGAKKSYGDKPAYGNKAAFGAKKNYGDRPAPAAKKPEAAYPRDDEQAVGVSMTQYMQNEQPAQNAQDDEAALPCLIYGRNPVREAIKSEKSIDKLFVLNTGNEDGSLRELMRMAREAKLVISEVSHQKLDELTLPFGYGGKPAAHQGIVAMMSEVPYVELEAIIEKGKAHAQEYPPFVIILDSINDPHNLGAIIRSAVCAGADGVVIPKRRSASVTAAAAKASAGAVMYADVARVPNLTAAVKTLKDAGYWIAGADAEGQDMRQTPLSGPLALIIGGEDEGLSRLLKESCDFLAAIPMFGPINSLNASNAAAVLMYEKLRQDGRKN